MRSLPWRACAAPLLFAASLSACRQKPLAPQAAAASQTPGLAAHQVWQREVGPQHPSPTPVLVTTDGRVAVLGSQPASAGLRRATLFVFGSDGTAQQEVAGADFESELGRGLSATGASGPDGRAYILDGAGGLFVLPPGGQASYAPGFARPRPGPPPLAALSTGDLAVAGEDDITVATPPGAEAPGMKWRVWQRARALLAGSEGGLYFVGVQGAGALRADGTLAWSAEVAGGEALALSRSNDLLVGSASAVLAFDAGGRRQWEFRKREPGPAGLALAPDGRLIAASAHEVLALAPDGRLAWSWRLPPQEPALSEPPLVGPDGLIYVSANGRHVLTAAGALRGRLAGLPVGALTVVSSEAFYVRSTGGLHALLLPPGQS